MKEQEIDEFLDGLEGVLVEYMQKVCLLAGKAVTEKEARNIVGKVGSRIMFGKEVFDDAFIRVKK